MVTQIARIHKPLVKPRTKKNDIGLIVFNENTKPLLNEYLIQDHKPRIQNKRIKVYVFAYEAIHDTNFTKNDEKDLYM